MWFPHPVPGGKNSDTPSPFRVSSLSVSFIYIYKFQRRPDWLFCIQHLTSTLWGFSNDNPPNSDMGYRICYMHIYIYIYIWSFHMHIEYYYCYIQGTSVYSNFFIQIVLSEGLSESLHRISLWRNLMMGTKLSTYWHSGHPAMWWPHLIVYNFWLLFLCSLKVWGKWSAIFFKLKLIESLWKIAIWTEVFESVWILTSVNLRSQWFPDVQN